MRRQRRDGDRRDPTGAVAHRRRPLAVARHRPGRDVLHLAGFGVPARQPAAEAAAVDDIGIAGEGEVVVALVAAHRMPVAESELAVVAAARHRHRAAVLLAAVDPVGEAVVGGHVVELAGRLVVPGAPGGTAVDGDHRSLVARRDHPLRVVRIDPQEMVVVAARSAAEEGEGLAAVRRAPDGLAHDVDRVRVFGIDGDAREVRAGEAAVGVDPLPGAAAVVRAVEAGRGIAAAGVDRGIDPPALAAGRHGEADASEGAGGQAVAGEPRPGPAAVGRFEDAASRAGVGDEIGKPRVAPELPGGGEDRVGRRRVRREVRGSRALVHEESPAPRPAAVGRAVDAALGVGTELVALGRGEHHVGVVGIDPQAADVAAVGEPAVLPRPAAVGGAVDAVAGGDVPAGGHLAGAHVEDGRIAGRESQRPDRSRALLVEERIPGAAGVGRHPHAAVGGADVERLRLARNARGTGRPAAAQRTGEAPAQGGEGVRRHGGRGEAPGRGGQGEGDGEARGEAAKVHASPPGRSAKRVHGRRSTRKAAGVLLGTAARTPLYSNPFLRRNP